MEKGEALLFCVCVYILVVLLLRPVLLLHRWEYEHKREQGNEQGKQNTSAMYTQTCPSSSKTFSIASLFCRHNGKKVRLCCFEFLFQFLLFFILDLFCLASQVMPPLPAESSLRWR